MTRDPEQNGILKTYGELGIGMRQQIEYSLPLGKYRGLFCLLYRQSASTSPALDTPTTVRSGEALYPLLSSRHGDECRYGMTDPAYPNCHCYHIGDSHFVIRRYPKTIHTKATST